MKEISEEDLIGYLLGALEAHEERAIDEAMRQSSALREKLAHLEETLTRMPDRFVEIDPPSGLVEKTLNTIDIVNTSIRGSADQRVDLSDTVNQTDARSKTQSRSAKLRSVGSDQYLSGRGRSWSMMDMIVGAAVCFVIAVMLLPSIANSRFQSNLLYCQDNLRNIGYNLGSIADNFDGRVNFAMPSDQWQAGQFIEMILDAELAENTGEFICPNDPGKQEVAELCRLAWNDRFAGNLVNGMPPSFSLVTPEMETTQPSYAPDSQTTSSRRSGMRVNSKLVRSTPQRDSNPLWQSEAACGSYGFPVPTLNGDRFNSIRIPSHPNEVLCADAACFDNPGFQSRNHAGKGQNVLLGDLSVDYICNTACLPSGDHIYTNKLGKVQPGIGPGDNLIIRGSLPIEATWPRLK